MPKLLAALRLDGLAKAHVCGVLWELSADEVAARALLRHGAVPALAAALSARRTGALCWW
jgi:hypothetical protein